MTEHSKLTKRLIAQGCAALVSGWQPIETAPKDGTPVLVFDGDDMTTAKWAPWAGDLTDGRWALVACGAYAEDDRFEATHWMPLPAPPAGI